MKKIPVTRQVTSVPDYVDSYNTLTNENSFIPKAIASLIGEFIIIMVRRADSKSQ